MSVAVISDKWNGETKEFDEQLEVAILDNTGVVNSEYLDNLWGDSVRPHIESLDELCEVIREVKQFVATQSEKSQGQLEFNF